MVRRLSFGALVMMIAAFGLTLCGPPKPTVAKVEVPPPVKIATDYEPVAVDVSVGRRLRIGTLSNSS